MLSVLAILLASIFHCLRADEGWMEEGHSTRAQFELHRAEMNFYEAQLNCWDKGAQLASFGDLAEYQMLVDLCNGTNCWIGLHHLREKLPGLPNYRLYFSDGEHYHFTTEEVHGQMWGRYHASAENAPIPVGDIPSVNETKLLYEPNNFGEEEGCTEIWFNNTHYVSAGKLNDRPCASWRLPAHVCRRRDEDSPTRLNRLHEGNAAWGKEHLDTTTAETTTPTTVASTATATPTTVASTATATAKPAEMTTTTNLATTSTVSTIVGKCTDGWVPGHNDPAYCVKVFRTPENPNFAESQEKCRIEKGRLASFSDVEEFMFLTKLCGDTDCWLGLYHVGERLPGPPNFQLHFLDGFPYALSGEHEKLWGRYYADNDGNSIPRSEGNSTSCTGSEPNTPAEHCAVLRVRSDYYINGEGLLDDTYCDKSMPAYVCKRRAGAKDEM